MVPAAATAADFGNDLFLNPNNLSRLYGRDTIGSQLKNPSSNYQLVDE